MTVPPLATLFLVALKPEWAVLKNRFRWTRDPGALPFYRLGGTDGVGLLQTGPGPERCLAVFREFLADRPCRTVFHFGTCGALDDSLSPGDLLIAREIADANSKERVPCDTRLLEDMPDFLRAEKIPCREGALLTSPRVLKNAFEKRAARETANADGVDMESFAVAKFCREAGIAYNAVRAVFDRVDEDLEKMGQPYTAAGELAPARLAVNLVKAPQLILKLPDFKKRMDRIGERITRAAVWHGGLKR